MDLRYRELYDFLSNSLGESKLCPMYLLLKILLLQQHSLGRPRAASKVTKAVIKATTQGGYLAQYQGY